MGLDTSHGAWCGSYTSFNEWRRSIAHHAGFPPLDEMHGFGGSKRWGTTPGDQRLIPLLHHSDCDGEIEPADCLGVAAALEELLPKIAVEWVRRKTEEFTRGCRAAHAAGEPLEFH